MVFFEEVSNKKVFFKIPCFYFPLYEVLSFGIVSISLALPNFPLINYLIIYEIIFLYIWLYNYYY